MIAEEDEYFLRASILLLKGGRLVSKETLYKELRKAGRNLDALLKQHERKFKYKFVKKQREKLFPDAGVTDVETWDLAMLTTVTLKVFKQSLNEDEKNDLKSIKCMRDEIYAHTYSSSLSADQYEEIRKELQNALTSLSNGLSQKLKDDCSNIIQECTTGPISPSLKAELTKQIEDTEHALLAVMNKLRNQEEFLCEMKKDIMDTLNKMRVTEDRSEKIIKVIDTELTLSGAVNESKSIDFAEEIITKVINKAIKKVGNENDYPRIRGVVDKILKDIENMPDVEILPAEHKCILLKFRCTTYIGISNILMYLESRSFLDSLNDLALALSSTLPNMSGQYRLDVTVTPECMKDLLDELRAKTMETTKYERTIRVPIKVKSVQGIEHIWSLFETGGATVRLNELSEAVFNELNTKITVKPSVNLEQIQAAIKEAGKKSAKVSHEDVEDNASFPHRLQSKSVVEVCRSYDDSDVKETVIGTKNASFETRNRRAFDTNDPLFEPEEIGSFSLDINRKYDNTTKQLKYFVKPPANRVHFDLRKGYSTMIRKDESKPDFITDILRWITDNKEKLVEQDIKTKRQLNTDFVCWRGLYTKFLCTPYEDREGWLVAVTLYNGTYYMFDFHTEQKKKQKASMTQRDDEMSCWGWKFEQYLTSDSPTGVPDTESPYNNCEAFCTVVRSRLNSHSLVYSGEVDAVHTDDVHGKHYIELKTSRDFSHPRQYVNFKRFKLIKWWAQSFLVGIPEIVCGYRDDDGIVHRLESFSTKELPEIAKDISNPWKANVCFNFLDQLLSFIKSTVKIDDHRTVHLLQWSPGEPVLCSKPLSDSEYNFLPDWYTD